jgi:hypothetical protein
MVLWWRLLASQYLTKMSTVDHRSQLVGVQIPSPLLLPDFIGVDEPISAVWSGNKPSSANSAAAEIPWRRALAGAAPEGRRST